MTPTVYLNGQLISADDAKIDVFDGGFLHGAGVFETMRADNGRIFRLDQHLDRIRRSAAELLAPIEEGVLPGESDFSQLLEHNRLKTARVRLTLSSGSVLEGPETATPLPTVCATASPSTGYPAEFYDKGVQVAICPYRVSPSDPVAGHKTTAYLPRLMGLRTAGKARCVEAIWFTTENRLAEGCISNVFLVAGRKLKTPPLDTPVLPGVARACVIDLAAQADLEVVQEPLTIDDLLDADEVFLTNVIMQVMPVTRVERHDIGDASVGPVTKKLLAAFRRCVKQECQTP